MAELSMRDAWPASAPNAQEYFRLAIQSVPTAMLMVDALGVIVMVNELVEKLFGYGPQELVGKHVEVLVPERFRAGHPALRGQFNLEPRARAMGAGRELYGLRKDGSEVPIEIGLNPLHTPEGSFVLSSVVDITERIRAAEHFRLAIEASPTGMIMLNDRGRIVLVNAQVEKLFGYARHELIGAPLEMLVPERFRAQHPKLRAEFMSNPQTRAMGAGRDLFGLRKGGEEIAIEIGLNPLHTPDGAFVLSSVVDITERKRAAERLADSLHEKETLLKEIHHRVKNNLQVISSLLSLQANYVTDEQTRNAFAQSQARVHSIALVHEKLYQVAELSRISFTEYMRELVDHLIYAQAAEQRAIECVVHDSDLRLSIDTSIACGLMVNELVTNSLKHAFPNGRRGRIDVSLKQIDDYLELCVKDDGLGLPDAIDVKNVKSLGLDLVATFAQRLKAEYIVQRQPGASFTLRFKGN
jgi:PAS domain S-box-containing protein